MEQMRQKAVDVGANEDEFMAGEMRYYDKKSDCCK